MTRQTYDTTLTAEHLYSGTYDTWNVTLKRNGKTRTLLYRMGPGHHGAEPTLYHVLTSLKMDATYGASFEEWCGDLGYVTDSRRAYDLYLDCRQSEIESIEFFGAEVWDKIVNDENYE